MEVRYTKDIKLIPQA